MWSFYQAEKLRAGVKLSRRSRNGLQTRTNELARFKSLGVIGGLDATYLAVDYDRGVEALSDVSTTGETLPPENWRVEFRQMLLVPTERVVEVLADPWLASAPSLPGHDHELALTRKDDPTRLNVMNASAHCLQFSRIPLVGGEDAVRAYLDVRYGRRMSTTFGSLSGSTK